MNVPGPGFGDQASSHVVDDVRQQVSSIVLKEIDVISGDAIAIFPYSGNEFLEPAYCRHIAHLLAQILALSIRDSRVDPRNEFLGDLHRMVTQGGLPIERLFTFVYFVERAALDELALSDDLGATSEPWPIVAQLVRRGSFDVLAAYAHRTQLEPSGAMIDRLTTLFTRALFDAVLAKEVERAGRYGVPISLILFDVDRLAAINREFGYGVGDKVLERLGILIQKYFRHHDWVARYGEDSVAVILTRTEGDQASDLAEQVRRTVEDRLWFIDHRTEHHVPVTVSAAVVNIAVPAGTVIDRELLLVEAENGLERAKRVGRNRVERVVYPSVAS